MPKSPNNECVICGQPTDPNAADNDCCDVCINTLVMVQGNINPLTSISMKFVGLVRCYCNPIDSSLDSHTWKSPDGKIWNKNNWYLHPKVGECLSIRHGIKIGDRVKVINGGHIYDFYEEWANDYKLTNFVRGSSTISNIDLTVVTIGYHSLKGELINRNVLLGIEMLTAKTHQQWIIDLQGIQLIGGAVINSRNTPSEKPKPQASMWNCKCNICGADAYMGLQDVECSSKSCPQNTGNSEVAEKLKEAQNAINASFHSLYKP